MQSFGISPAPIESLHPVFSSRLRMGDTDQLALRLTPAIYVPEIAHGSSYDVVRTVIAGLGNAAQFTHPQGERITISRTAPAAYPGIFDVNAQFKGMPVSQSESLRERVADFLSMSLGELPLQEQLFLVVESKNAQLYTAHLEGFISFQRHIAPLIKVGTKTWLPPNEARYSSMPVSQIPKTLHPTRQSAAPRRRR